MTEDTSRGEDLKFPAITVLGQEEYEERYDRYGGYDGRDEEVMSSG